jgi:hypothetical protein
MSVCWDNAGCPYHSKILQQNGRDERQRSFVVSFAINYWIGSV